MDLSNARPLAVQAVGATETVPVGTVANLKQAAQSAHVRYQAAVKEAQTLRDQAVVMREKIEALQAAVSLMNVVLGADGDASYKASYELGDAVDRYDSRE